jgi:hypothetical protein
MRIRRAVATDVPALLEVKQSLRFDQATGTSTRGGFLLGTDAAGYRQRMADGNVWVLEDQRVVGFAIVLPDAGFRGSEVWRRRDAVRWTGADADTLAGGRLCYYDQLAVQRLGFRVKRWGAALALTALRDVLDGHDHVVTGTVYEPIRNLAAVPYLQRVGGRVVGRLDEHEPSIGRLRTDIWLVDRADVTARVRAPVGRAERWVVDAATDALDQSSSGLQASPNAVM